MIKIRENKTKKEKEIENEKKRLGMQKLRENQNKTEKDESNEKARLRMLFYPNHRETS